MSQRILNLDKRLYKAAIFLSVFSISISSCKKVESDLGIDVLPGDDQLNMLTDTFNVTGYSIKEDSIRTDEFSNNMLGSYNDPVFGKTDASIYTEIRLETFVTGFPNGIPVVDSVVLSLNISGHYGNESIQTFEVFQITEDIIRDSAYYSNTVKGTIAIDLVEPGFGTFKPSLTAEPVIDGDVLEPQIRLRLKNSFGDMIFDSLPGITNDDQFDNFINGIYIRTNNPGQMADEGGIYYLDLEHGESLITIYYHDTQDTLKFDLPINDKCARFTHIDHDYTTAPEISQQLIDSIGSDFYYLQAGGGLVANLNLPDIFDLQADGNVIINKAELYLPVQHYSISPYAPPARILAFGIDDEDEIYTMPDFSYPGPSVYGGFYDDDKKAYVFNIMRYVQDVLKGDVANNAIRIVPTSSSVSVNRVVLSGNNSPNREKPYIKIYYTKY